MKKLLLLLLISSLVALSFISCEGDIFENLSDFMGQTGENVLITQGVYVPSTEHVEAVSTTLSGIGSDAPVTPEQIDDLKDSVAEILESESETGAAAEDMKEPVEDEEIPVGLETDIAEIEDALGLDSGTIVIEDKGDLVAVILMKGLKDELDAVDEDTTPEEKEAIVADGEKLLEFIVETSAIGSMDITGALGDLLSELTKSSPLADTLIETRALTRLTDPAPEEEYDLDTFVDMAGPIFEALYNTIDTDGTPGISAEEFTTAKNKYGQARSTIDGIAPHLQVVAEATGVKNGTLMNIVHYAFAVILTENDKMLPVDPDTTDEIDYPTMIELLELVHDYFNGDTSEAPDWPWLTSGYVEAMMNRIYGLSTFTTIQNTLLALSNYVEENTYVTDMLTEFFADLAE